MKSKNHESGKNRLNYFLLLAFSIVIYGLFKDYYATVFIVLVLFLPVISYAIPYILFHFIQIEFIPSIENTLPDQENRLKMNIHTIGNLPASNIHIQYFITQPFSRYSLHDSLHLENESIPITLHHCGKVDFSIRSFTTYDLLYLFPIRKHIRQDFTYYIYPKIVPVNHTIEMLKKEKKPEKGDDLTEIYELKEYQQGDPIRSIHWKLSSKSNKIISKVGTNTSDSGSIFYFQTSPDPDVNDRTLALFHSLCIAMIKETSLNIAYAKDEEIIIETVNNISQYYEVLENILSLPLAQSIDYTDRHVYTFKGGKLYGFYD